MLAKILFSFACFLFFVFFAGNDQITQAQVSDSECNALIFRGNEAIDELVFNPGEGITDFDVIFILNQEEGNYNQSNTFVEFRISGMGWVSNRRFSSISPVPANGQSQLIFANNTNGGPIANNTVTTSFGTSSVEFRAVINGNRCGTTRSLPFREANPLENSGLPTTQASCEMDIRACRQDDGKYTLYGQISYVNFNPGGNYQIVPNGTWDGWNPFGNNFVAGSVPGANFEFDIPNQSLRAGQRFFCVKGLYSGDATCGHSLCDSSENPTLIGAETQACSGELATRESRLATVLDLGFSDELIYENLSSEYKICSQIPNLEQRIKCVSCVGIGDGGDSSRPGGVWTAVGCIETDFKQGLGRIIGIGLSIAGGITILRILAAAFMLSTSQGEAKRTGEARDIITSSIIGLLFIIFSVVILQYVGSDILKIPGFGEGQ